MPTSRFRRPLRPSGRLELQGRDLDLLKTVALHRFVQAGHVRELVFSGRTLRVVQSRLRKLWEHSLLDRHFVPYTLDGVRQPPSVASTPTYSLGVRGVDLLARALGVPASAVGPGPSENKLSVATLAHHVIVTDFLSALEVACRARGGPELVEGIHEWELWRRLSAARISSKDFVVPDASLTLRYPGHDKPETWYVEIVRASPAGGNERFREKMLRYAELQRAGRFRKVFGDANLRGVLVAAPSSERAANLRAHTVFVPGRRFFAFTHFEERTSGKTTSRFRSDTLLSLEWVDGGGDLVRLGESRDASSLYGP